jgi:hypothetical protein
VIQPPLAVGYWAAVALLTVIPLVAALLAGALIARTRSWLVALDLGAVAAWLVGSSALAVRGCPDDASECYAGVSFIVLLLPLGFWIFGVHAGKWLAGRRPTA